MRRNSKIQSVRPSAPRNAVVKKVSKQRLAELMEKDLSLIAWHEAGHCIVLDHFGYLAKLCIWDNGERALEKQSVFGRVKFMNLPELSGYELSVFGWAGLIAEKLEADPKQDADTLEFNVDWEDMEGLSGTDRANIHSHFQKRRTCKTAARILIKKYGQLKVLANEVRRRFVWNGHTSITYSRRWKPYVQLAECCCD